MPAATLNFSIEKGTDFEINFQYNDTNGNPINLVDKCVVLQLVPVDGDGSCLTFSSAANTSINVHGWSITGNADGQIILKILGSETNELDFTSGQYDLDVIDYSQSNQLVSSTRLAQGTIFVLQRNALYLSNCPTSNSYRGSCLNQGGVTVSTRRNYTNSGFQDADFTDSVFTNTNFTNVKFDNCTFFNSDFSLSNISGAILPTEETAPAGDSGQTDDATDNGQQQTSDLCLSECLSLDLYAVSYDGSGITILDESISSGVITIDETVRTIDTIDIAIGGLSHTNPQDLIFTIQPPSGSGIVLSSNQKIPRYVDNFNFIFSNKAAPTKYLHNISNGEYCRIYDKSNPDYLTSFDHLSGSVPSGDWVLSIEDTDPLASGTIDSWKVVVTYNS